MYATTTLHNYECARCTIHYRNRTFLLKRTLIWGEVRWYRVGVVGDSERAIKARLAELDFVEGGKGIDGTGLGTDLYSLIRGFKWLAHNLHDTAVRRVMWCPMDLQKIHWPGIGGGW